MRRTGTAALVSWAIAVAVGAGGCERIIQWTGDAGEDGGEDGGGDAGDGGMDASVNLGDGGTGAYLGSFGPGTGPFYVRVPSLGYSTYPTPLSVSILRDGESGPVRVNVSSSDASVASVAANGVDIGAGTVSSEVRIISTQQGTATLTATFDGGMRQVTVVALPTVVISELAAENGGTGPNNEFVELYNPTAQTFDLTGCVLQYRSSNAGGVYVELGTLSGSIAPYRYYLVGLNSYTGISTDESFPSTNQMAAGAGSVRLGAPGVGTGDTDVLALDTVGWISSLNANCRSFETAPVNLGLSGWGSIERKARSTSDATSMSTGPDVSLGNARDTDNNAQDFVIRGTRQPQSSSSTETPPDGG